MSKVVQFTNKDGSVAGYSYECPACNQRHALVTKCPPSLHDVWQYQGPSESPSFFPSVLRVDGDLVCHSLIRNGQIRFLSDCTNGFADKIVDMLDID